MKTESGKSILRRLKNNVLPVLDGDLAELAVPSSSSGNENTNEMPKASHDVSCEDIFDMSFSSSFDLNFSAVPNNDELWSQLLGEDLVVNMCDKSIIAADNSSKAANDSADSELANSAVVNNFLKQNSQSLADSIKDKNKISFTNDQLKCNGSNEHAEDIFKVPVTPQNQLRESKSTKHSQRSKTKLVKVIKTNKIDKRGCKLSKSHELSIVKPEDVKSKDGHFKDVIPFSSTTLSNKYSLNSTLESKCTSNSTESCDTGYDSPLLSTQVIIGASKPLAGEADFLSILDDDLVTCSQVDRKICSYQEDELQDDDKVTDFLLEVADDLAHSRQPHQNDVLSLEQQPFSENNGINDLYHSDPQAHHHTNNLQQQPALIHRKSERLANLKGRSYKKMPEAIERVIRRVEQTERRKRREVVRRTGRKRHSVVTEQQEVLRRLKQPSSRKTRSLVKAIQQLRVENDGEEKAMEE